MSFCRARRFLEKDGTFTNAERRINRVRRVMQPLGGAEWQGDLRPLGRARYPMAYATLRNHGGIARRYDAASECLLRILDEKGSVNGRCNDAAPTGTLMHVCRAFRARQGPIHADANMCRPTSGRDRFSRCF